MYLKLLHTHHVGIEKSKLLARNTFFWPGLNKQIEDMVVQCETCQIYQNQQKKEPELKHDIPERPWTKVGTDLFTLNSKDFVIVIDYTTNFFDIALIPNKESSTVVKYTKQIFSRYGIPKKVMSDNGPEFIGKAYKKFSRNWDFKHDSSSPRYPQSNGQVERMIQYVKKTLKKACKDERDPYLALMTIRATPGPYCNAAPATLMFQRPIRSIIPSVNAEYDSKNNKLNKSKKKETDNDNSNSNSKKKLTDNNNNRYVYEKKVTDNDNSNYKSKKKLTDNKVVFEKKETEKGINLKKLDIHDQVRLHDGKTWSTKGKIVAVLNQP